MPPKDLETEREFTPAEAQLLIDAREIFGNNVCQLANFIGGNITCLEVRIDDILKKLHNI